MPKPLRDRLATGTTRDLGCTNEVVREALRSPTHTSSFVEQLVAALDDERLVVPHRASNALKKIQRANPALLHPFSKRLLHHALETTHLHTRWNLLIILGELPLRGRDKSLAIDLMFEALAGRSAFERVFALQALTNYAQNDDALRKRIQPILTKASTDPSASIRARARKLMKQVAVSN